MQHSLRALIVLVMMALVASQFQNCSKYSDSSSLYGNTCSSSDTACATSLTYEKSGPYLTPRFEQPRMECTHGQIQVGGTCEIDDATDSYIEYSLTDVNGNALPWADNSTLMREARCENGRFTLIIPRPKAGVVGNGSADLATTKTNFCSNSDCLFEMRLTTRLLALQRNTSQFEVVATGPVLSLTMQAVVNTATGLVCP